MKRATLCLALSLIAIFELDAQFRPVDPKLTHYRVVAIVPVTGLGTKESPKVPLLSNLPGVIAWRAEVSDNRQLCLVELVARTSAALDAAFTHPGWLQAAQNRVGLPPGVSMLMQRKDDPNAKSVYAEFAKLKKGFQPEAFGVAVP